MQNLQCKKPAFTVADEFLTLTFFYNECHAYNGLPVIIATEDGKIFDVSRKPSVVKKKTRDFVLNRLHLASKDTMPMGEGEEGATVVDRTRRNSSPKKQLVVSVTPKEVQLFESIKKYVFIVGTALIVFAAARNSVTWHVQQFWGASANFWQYQWKKVYDFFEGDDYMIGVVGSFVWSFGVFWFFNFFLIFLDVTGKPQFLLKYKIQPNSNVPVDKYKLRRAILTVLFNQTVIGIPLATAWFYVMKWRGCRFDPESLPSFTWVLVELMVFTLAEEVFFYYSHRLLHHPRIYKYIHKKHHEWTAPIGIIGIYAHPVEHVISNMLPVLLGPTLLRSHMATSWLWFALGLVQTSISHCGYHFPLLPSPEAHDFHHFKLLHTPQLYKHIHKSHHEWTAPIGIIGLYAHPIEHAISNVLPVMMGPCIMGSHCATLYLWFAVGLMSSTSAHSGYHFPLQPSPEAHDFHHNKFTNNFGVLGVLDRLHGTDANFRASKAYERHIMLLSLTPLSQQIPDNPKQKPE